MSRHRKELFDFLRPRLKSAIDQDFIKALDAILDRAGMPRDEAPAPAPAPSPPPPSAPTSRLDVAGLRSRLGLPAESGFDAEAAKTLFAQLSNRQARALTDEDFAKSAADLAVSEKMIRAVRKVEAPRGPFDEDGRPSILYERHVFARNTLPKGRFNRSHPLFSGGPYGRGGYGGFAAQYGKLAAACALDPEAAFRACSWGAFQVLGENAVSLGYDSAFDMALALTAGEAAHLESFVRFVRTNKLVDKLKACRPGDPASCVPFVRAYNGAGFAEFGYHKKLAQAAL